MLEDRYLYWLLSDARQRLLGGRQSGAQMLMDWNKIRKRNAVSANVGETSIQMGQSKY